MELTFYKYQGAGNDFVIIDDRENLFDKKDHQLVKFLCDRRFGVGADGLMLLRSSKAYDFEMVYFNADGYEGSMCGNGGRCIVAFAYHQKIITEKCQFIAIDGPHEAAMLPIGSIGNDKEWVSLKMIDVSTIEKSSTHCFMDTGSPHYVAMVNNLQDYDVVQEGKSIRYNDRFKNTGTNVNFIQVVSPHELHIRTYERGVEDETLACGTGVTAAVLTAHQNELLENNTANVKALGGNLNVNFDFDGQVYSNIYLQGPAEFVFKGALSL